MELGRHLRELSRLRFGAAICVLVATFAALSLSYKISLFPPGLTPRGLQMASASTEVLVDTPKSLVLDMRQDTNDVESLTNRSVLMGNVMASPPVLEYIGRRAGVPGSSIKATTPRTPNSPRPFATPENKKRSADLLASTDQYRLDIEANPTVPVLKIYAQAPGPKVAGELANAAVDGLRDYLTQIVRAQGIPVDQQIRVEQLGRARGVAIDGGVSPAVTVIAFLVFLAASAAAGIFFGRVRRGFQLAGEQDELETARRGGRRASGGDAPRAPSSSADERDLVAR